ncbi:putative DNA-binding transcriptional regulator AlpA [Bradyrhizobium japonicum]
MSAIQDTKRFLPTSKVLARYGRTRTWLELKLRNDARFPRPYTFGTSRRSWLETELEAYDRECAARA